MTQQELCDYMLTVWRNQPGSGLSTDPSDDAIIKPMLMGIAAGIFTMSVGGTAGVAEWYKEVLGNGIAGTQFTLTYVPVPGSETLFINGVMVSDYTINAKTVVLVESKPASADLIVKYQIG